MQKKLIALAIAGAFVAPAAFADSGNVTIYGKVSASYDITDNGSGTTAAGATVSGTRTNKVSSNASYIGFKGSEDLGNGLSAVWQVEQQVNIDGNNATNGAATAASWNSRNTFVGLSGKSWGTVILGQHDTPYKLSTRSLDVFADTLGDNRSLMGGGNGGGAAAAFDGRQSNVVAYISPTMNGFTGAIAYVAGAEAAAASADKKGSAWSAMVNYSNGPWYGALAYEKHSLGDVASLNNGAIAANTLFNGQAAVAANGLADRSEKAWKLGVGYKANAVRVGFAYEHTTDDFNAGSDLLGHNAWTLGGGYTFGNNEVKLAYTKAGDFNVLSNTGAKQWALGLDHNFSKRTSLYALYTKLSNDTNKNYTLGSAGYTTGLVAAPAASFNNSASAWSFGMKHTF